MRVELHVAHVIYVIIGVTFVKSQSLPSSLCTGCRVRNGKGYNIDPDHCYNYVQCHFNQGGFGAAQRRPCPPGQFWDQSIATCVPAGRVDCGWDECKSGKAGYTVNGNCRAYWKCEGKRTVGIACCQSGYRYYNGFGCLSDASCKDDCPPTYKIDRTCYYTPDPTNPSKYRYRQSLLKMCCPRGLAFQQSTCGCTRGVNVTQTDWCQPSVRIEFKRRIFDSSLGQISITNRFRRVRARQDSTATDGWVGNFTGTGRLMMPRFSNSPFGKEFKIFIRFKEHPGPSRGTEVVISNADCGARPTMMLSFDRNTKLLTFLARIKGVDKQLVVRYIEGAWKDVFIMYEIDTLYMSIDNRDDNANVLFEQQISIHVSGAVDVSACALNLGYGEQGVNFRGIVDAFRVYLCA